MISGKIKFFQCFVCILEKCSGKYSTLCVWSNVKKKKKKKPTPKITGIQQKWEPPLLATQTYPETHLATHPTTYPATHPC